MVRVFIFMLLLTTLLFSSSKINDDVSEQQFVKQKQFKELQKQYEDLKDTDKDIQHQIKLVENSVEFAKDKNDQITYVSGEITKVGYSIALFYKLLF